MCGNISKFRNRAYTGTNHGFSFKVFRALQEVDDPEAKRKELAARTAVEMREHMFRGDYSEIRERYAAKH